MDDTSVHPKNAYFPIDFAEPVSMVFKEMQFAKDLNPMAVTLPRLAEVIVVLL